MGFEETNEMLRIVKTHTFANHCDGQRVIIEQLFGMGEKAVGNDVLGSTTSFHAHQIAEIAAGQAAFVCKIGHCGQSLTQGFRGDVVIQQFHESLHHRMVDFLASDELAVIEAETLVQQQLDVGDDKFAGMLVYGMVQLLLYHSYHTPEDFHLLDGEMQSLGTGIVEELITAHLSA